VQKKALSYTVHKKQQHKMRRRQDHEKGQSAARVVGNDRHKGKKPGG
jgi:hypothetical protein